MQPASVAQVVGQLVALPSQTNGEQVGLPALPLVAIPQTPGPPAPLHVLQAPEHAVPQHTPLAQNVDWHMVAREQELPVGSVATH